MVLDLPVELTLTGAAALKTALLEALAGAPRVELDARAVAEVDAAGLQVLCAAHRSAAALGKQLVFAGGACGPVVQAACAAGGLRGQRPCPAGCAFQEGSPCPSA